MASPYLNALSPSPDPMPRRSHTDPSPGRVRPDPDPAVVDHPGLTEEQNRRGLLQALAVKRARDQLAAGEQVSAGTARRLGTLQHPLALSGTPGSLQSLSGSAYGELLAALIQRQGRPQGAGAARYSSLF